MLAAYRQTTGETPVPQQTLAEYRQTTGRMPVPQQYRQTTGETPVLLYCVHH